MVRVRNRYFLLEIVCKDYLEETLLKLPFSGEDVTKKLVHSLVDIFGDYGIAVVKVGLTAKIFNRYTRIVYLRARRGPHVLVASVLPFVTEIKGVPCFLRTLHLAGSIRSCHKFLKHYHHEKMMALLKRCSNEEEKVRVQASIRKSLSGLEQLTGATVLTLNNGASAK